jgi:hypothetical protein
MSTGEFLTLRFKSNNSTTSNGFRFRIDNGPGVSNKTASPLPTLWPAPQRQLPMNV